MPITPLPEDTVRQLGSTLVIASPVSLLKELLDNAIDSGATSIDVLVSPNTVDRIEVRDNGCGISPEDHDFLGRPGYTSKLKSFDDVANIAGNTLGFRGTALASANLVADVSVTTRVPTERVATSISLAKGGGVKQRRHVAAPVGTTVTATGLFSRMPVRLRVAMKDEYKNLARMRDLLQAYIFARPRLRLRFTVLKTPALSWSYAPSPASGAKEAATQLLGAEHASQCTLKIFPSGAHQDRDGLSGDGDVSSSPATRDRLVIFEALLPSLDADPRKLVKGAFFSVDGRPLSPTLGVAKKLLSSFKQCLAARVPSLTPRDVFIALNIRCPTGSYDVNVEPSKNDVLFNQEQIVLDQFEAFLRSTYPTPNETDSTQSPATAEVRDSEARTGKNPGSPVRRLPHDFAIATWKVDMSSRFDASSWSDEDDTTDNRSQDQPRQPSDEGMIAGSKDGICEGDGVGNEKEGLNPWSIAKLAGMIRRREPPSQEPIGIYREQALSSASNGSAIYGLGERMREAERSRISRRDGERRLDLTSQNRSRQPFSKQNSSATFDYARSQQTTLERRTGQNSRGSQSFPASQLAESDGGKRPPAQYMAGLGRLVQSQSSFDEISRQRSGHRRDYSSSVPKSLPFRAGQRTTGAAPTYPVDISRAVRATVNTDNAPWNRRLMEPGSMASTLPRAMPQEHSLPRDPQAHLVIQRGPEGQNRQKKPKRLRTEQLPLETIPQGTQTCTLSLTLKVDECNLAKMLTDVLRFDPWAADGRLRLAFKEDTNPEEMATSVALLLERVGSAGMPIS